MPRTALVVGFGLLATAAALTAQQSSSEVQTRPVFRLGVNFVEVDAIVTDASGRFVRTLGPGDFQILEDGVPQAVSVFSLVDIPIERDNRPLFRPDPVPPDVLTNDGDLEGRVYYLVLDDLHIDGSRTGQVRQMAQSFINQYVAANDLVSVIHVGQSNANQAFTLSKPLLRQSVARFMGRKLRSRTLNKLDDARLQNDLNGEGLNPVPLLPVVDFEAPRRSQWAQRTMQSIEDLSRYVSRLQGRRKAMVFFSEGIDYDMEQTQTFTGGGRQVPSDLAAINNALQSMLEEATRANVSIYPVDPRGVAHELAGTGGIGALPGSYQVANTNGLEPTTFGGRAVAEGLREELDGSLDSLRTLADETGGVAVIMTNDFDRPFRRIVEENSTYYLLGYYPTNDATNGTFRDVTVQVSEPGLEVRARRGYYAPRDEKALTRGTETSVAVLTEVVNAPASSRGLTLRVVPQIFKSPLGSARVHLTIDIPASEIPFEPDGDVFTNELLMVWALTDPDGTERVSTTREAVFNLRPESYARAQQAGVTMVAEFDVPSAGPYQIRVAGFEQLSGRSGSVVGDITVPRFDSTLAMSSIVLAVPTAKVDFALSDGAGALARLLPAPPTTLREFAPSDRVALYTEIYDNDQRPHNVDITVRLTADDGTEVFSRADVRDHRELLGRAYGHLILLPLTQARAGRHVLTVEARSRLGTVVMREVEIMVR